MTVLKDVASVTSGTASGTTLTSASITIAANTNRSLYVWVFTSAATPPTCSAVNWNTSEGLTQLGTVLQGVTRGYLFRLKNPTATTATITATISATADTWALFWYSAYNVDQTTSEGTARTNVGTAGPVLALGIDGLDQGRSVGAVFGTASTAIVARDGIPYWVASGFWDGASAVSSQVNTSAPAGRLIGDLEFSVLAKENAETTGVSGTGWVKGGDTVFQTGFSFVWGWRIYNGTNVNPTWSWTTAADVWDKRHLFRDSRTKNTPVAALGTIGEGSGTTHTSTGANTTEDDVLAVYTDLANVNTSLSAPGGSWTERDDGGSATGPSRLTIGDQPIATSGTGSGNLSMTGGNAAWFQRQYEIYNADNGDQTEEAEAENIGATSISGSLASEAGDVYNTLAWTNTGTITAFVALGVGILPAAAAGNVNLLHGKFGGLFVGKLG